MTEGENQEMPSNLLQVNELVNTAMERAGVSRAEMARRLKVSPAAVTQALREDREMSLSHAQRMVRACGYRLSLRIITTDAPEPTYERALMA